MKESDVIELKQIVEKIFVLAEKYRNKDIVFSKLDQQILKLKDFFDYLNVKEKTPL